MTEVGLHSEEMKTLFELTKEVLELPAPQRLRLARIILDLSEEHQEFSPEVEEAWEREIVRRMDEVKAGRARSDTSDNVFSRLDERFRG